MKLLIAAIVMTCLVAACSDSTSEASTRYVTPAVGQIQSVSPDGSMLLVSDGASVCLQPVDAGEVECFEWRSTEDVTFPQLVAVWASDGSRLVFFDRIRAGSAFAASVWSLDTGAGRVTELIGASGTFPIDLAINNDDGRVVMMGQFGDSGLGIFLLGDSGEPELLAEGLLGTVNWESGTESLLVGQRTGPDAGIWRIDIESGSRRLLTPADDEYGGFDVTMVAPAGDAAVVAFMVRFGRRFSFEPDAPVLGSVDLTSGQMGPITPNTTVGVVGPVTAVLSSDGREVAYIYYDGAEMGEAPVLAIRPVAGGDEAIVDLGSVDDTVPELEQLSSLFGSPAAPIWTDAGRLIFPSREWALVVDLEP